MKIFQKKSNKSFLVNSNDGFSGVTVVFLENLKVWLILLNVIKSIWMFNVVFSIKHFHLISSKKYFKDLEKGNLPMMNLMVVIVLTLMNPEIREILLKPFESIRKFSGDSRHMDSRQFSFMFINKQIEVFNKWLKFWQGILWWHHSNP